MHTDDMNYYSDERVAASDRRWWKSISNDRRHALALVDAIDEADDEFEEEIWRSASTVHCNALGARTSVPFVTNIAKRPSA
jgi:hypothetical protein